MSSNHTYTITEQQRLSFEPTYLYIKRHKVTGLNYFGKTVRDPYKYNGSGIHWKNHLKKHGKQIETVWVHLFTDIDELVSVALTLSDLFDIVESDFWANLTPETGYGGNTSEQSKQNAQLMLETGKHNFKSKEFIEKQILRKKQEVINGTHISQINTKNGTHVFLSDQHRKQTGERNKRLAAEGKTSSQLRLKDPLYLEVKRLYEITKQIKPKFLHMKSKQFLEQKRIELSGE